MVVADSGPAAALQSSAGGLSARRPEEPLAATRIIVLRANGYDDLSRRAYTTLPRKLRLLVQDDYARRKADLRTQRDAPQTTAPRPA